jgi:hypothetical protein
MHNYRISTWVRFSSTTFQCDSGGDRTDTKGIVDTPSSGVPQNLPTEQSSQTRMGLGCSLANMEPDGPDIDPSGRPRPGDEKEIHPEHSQIKSIILEVPVREAYACCCRIAEWPRFIKSLHDVQCIDDNHFLLTSFVGNEARRTVLQIILRVPERRLVWQAISRYFPRGVILFDPLSELRTKITVKWRSNIEPVTLAKVTSDCLMSFKQFMEQGASH